MDTQADRQGFTLIELMIVVVVVGILALVAIPRFSGVSVQAKQAEADPILRQFCQLALADRERSGTWPAGDPTGWQNPSAKYYNAFNFNPANGVIVAATTEPGLSNRQMDCETGDIT